jgi:TonB family protein
MGSLVVWCTTLLLALVQFSSVLEGAVTQRTGSRASPGSPARKLKSFQNSVKPFDPSVASLPPGFTGHNAAELYKRLARRNLSLVKGEFETTESFERRVQAAAEKPILGILTERSVFAFVIGPSDGRLGRLEAKYDADRATLHARAELLGGSFGDAGKHRSLRWASFVTNHRFYKATNAFGARVTVEHYTQVFINIDFNNINRFSVARTYRDSLRDLAFAEDIRIDPLSAPRAKKNLRLLLVCLLASPYTSRSSGYVKPTIDNPYEESHYNYSISTELLEIWWFDSATGHVYARQIGVDLSRRLTRELRIIYRPQPHYTEEARLARIAGVVKLSVLLDALGNVADVQVIQGLSHGLTERAIQAAKQIKFEPGELNGKKVSVRLTLEYSFNLY